MLAQLQARRGTAHQLCQLSLAHLDLSAVFAVKLKQIERK